MRHTRAREVVTTVVAWLMTVLLWAFVVGVFTGSFDLKDGKDFGDPGCSARVDVSRVKP